MWGGEDEVFMLVNQATLGRGEFTPEDKYDVVLFGRYGFDDLVGKLLPAATLVTAGVPLFYRQSSVEEQDTLLGPVGEVTASRDWLVEVVRQLFVDVTQ